MKNKTRKLSKVNVSGNDTYVIAIDQMIEMMDELLNTIKSNRMIMRTALYQYKAIFPELREHIEEGETDVHN